jgi:hypothetical protein
MINERNSAIDVDKCRFIATGASAVAFVGNRHKSHGTYAAFPTDCSVKNSFMAELGAKTILLCTFYALMFILPRQAREKHREAQFQTPFVHYRLLRQAGRGCLHLQRPAHQRQPQYDSERAPRRHPDERWAGRRPRYCLQFCME